jgi:hypothetical protein
VQKNKEEELPVRVDGEEYKDNKDNALAYTNADCCQGYLWTSWKGMLT